MRLLLLIAAVIGFSAQFITEAGLPLLQDFFNLADNKGSSISPTNITEEEFLKNIFLSATIQPSLITKVLTGVCLLASIKLHNKPLKDLHIHNDDLKLYANFTNIILKSFDCSDPDLSGIFPVNNHTADLILPKFDIKLTFNYSINFGHDRPESGTGSITTDKLAWQARFETYQGEIEHKPEGPVRATLHSNTFNYTDIDGEFSDIYTQTEWDIFFEKPNFVKKTVQDIIGYIIKKQINHIDLRQLINFTYGKGVNLLFGISTPILYETSPQPYPDDRTISMKLHTIVTMPKGDHVEGLFPVNMQAPPLSQNYTSFIFNTDTLNKILSATTATESASFSFNQKFLDQIKFKLLRLDTTSLKPFFPTLEPLYGPDLGVYLKIYLPQYDGNRCYLKNSGGIVVAVLAVQLEIFVTRDPSTYYNSTLAECLTTTTCTRANTIEMDLYLKLPITFTSDQKMAFGFMDAEITNVIIVPPTFDPEMLKSKLNNFIDISLPHLIPPIDLSNIPVLNSFLISVDALDDQRVALALAITDEDN